MDADIEAWLHTAWAWLQPLWAWLRAAWADHYTQVIASVVALAAVITFITTCIKDWLEIRKNLKENPIRWPWQKPQPAASFMAAPTATEVKPVSQLEPGTTRPSGLYIPTTDQVRVFSGPIRRNGHIVGGGRPGGEVVHYQLRYGPPDPLPLAFAAVLGASVLLGGAWLLIHYGWFGTVMRSLLLILLPGATSLLVRALTRLWLDSRRSIA